MYKKGTGNDKQGKDAGNRTLCPYRNFSQAIIFLFYRMNGLVNAGVKSERIKQIEEEQFILIIWTYP